VHWKVKAAVQRACAALPVGGHALYYGLQRTFGLLRDPDRPLVMQQAGARIARDLRSHGFDIRGRRVLEVGTGWRTDLPIAFYLCGARSVDTYDLHRYVKPHLVMSAVAALARSEERLRETFRDLVEPDELGSRLAALARAADVQEVFRVAGIVYHAPADAAGTGLPAGAVDLHASHNVLQHIPPPVLADILREGARVLAPDGIAYHHVDLSDQFALADPSISRCHFLRFSDEEWARYGDNQFAYHNRLRVTDYERLFREAGHQVVAWATEVDERSARELTDGFRVAERFQRLSPEVLATDTLRSVTRAKTQEGDAPEGNAKV
jgi:SAM-dependent methyltransferase